MIGTEKALSDFSMFRKTLCICCGNHGEAKECTCPCGPDCPCKCRMDLNQMTFFPIFFLSFATFLFFFFLTGDFSDNPACWYYQQHTSVSKTLTTVINVFHQHPCLTASCFVVKSAKPLRQKTVPPPFTPYNVWCNFHLTIRGFIQSITIGQGLHYSQGHPAKPDLIESTLLKENCLPEE